VVLDLLCWRHFLCLLSPAAFLEPSLQRICRAFCGPHENVGARLPSLQISMRWHVPSSSEWLRPHLRWGATEANEEECEKPSNWMLLCWVVEWPYLNHQSILPVSRLKSFVDVLYNEPLGFLRTCGHPDWTLFQFFTNSGCRVLSVTVARGQVWHFVPNN
jgi:hypothetical protein